MADVFISYAREDRLAVEKLAGLLEAAGLICWWDKQLAAGARYRETTEAELNAANVVLVVWTKHSVGSHWVADEAAAAQEAGKIAPISLDGVSPPLGFRQFQVIDFTGWKGGADGPFQELVGALAAFTPQAEVKIASPPRQTASSAIRRFRWPLALAALVIAVTAGLFLLFGSRGSFNASPSQRVAFFGFTVADDNPVSRKIADDATDQTFAEFTRFNLAAAAKADSLAPSTTDRLTRAEALGAAYALSGDVRVEGEEARINIRLEDAATRVTLWETTETSPIDRQFRLPAKQAAFRAAGNISCIERLRAELSHESPEALQLVSGYCVRPFDPANLERALLTFRSLTKLEPRSAFLQTSLATNLVFIGAGLPAKLRAERFHEAHGILAEAMRTAPGLPFAVGTAEFLESIEGGSPLESEQLLATAKPVGSAWGDGFLFYRRGLNFLGNGRTEEGIARLRAAEAIAPSFTQVAAFNAYGLASQGKAADAEQLFERVFASEPGATLVWPTWVRAAVLEGIGDAEAVIAAAPENAPRAAVTCWRLVLAAKRAGRPGPAPETLSDCGPVVSMLAALGRVDEAFDRYQASPGQGLEVRMLFAPSARAMRADPRFLPLVKDLELWDYWIATSSHPDVCDQPEERDFDFCVQLRKAQTN